MMISIELLAFAMLSAWIVVTCVRCVLVVHSLRRLASTPTIYDASVPRIA
jgi:hypothetical protein